VDGVFITNRVNTSDKDFKYNADPSYLSKIQTMVTYNNCLTWERLKLDDGQTLNLHSYSSYIYHDIPHMITNSYGSLLGNGNVGDNLTFVNVGTYFSKNAGRDIKEVRELLNHRSGNPQAFSASPTSAMITSLHLIKVMRIIK
jgi:hypothetical protein